ncbi:substrate-binding domain-containing protein [Corynebacterium sp. 320]|uniref:LacI family DNA-binding transcriptional regulator n=1 Tax=Corynebacterium TaxID=1716 RepID=UPI00125CB271|nr:MULTISPECIES: LacI family DNA-binding transcriptional regulator [Corynebacterium]KAB1503027.1 substrate-binding domain-containing protein [Corynebacterium sp. 320]KAB1550764.1 substrate-binding domain-containing protein [Corynebacterium sp. 321]KAB1551121.1 substrate-binding domain-containing protein [Corynebacterium sp. 319]KAB3526824.1 substrate-binding domain-containing protein [Corynebacterium sp. 250]KAB3538317.1 substrate-binding domain-containing protein [Corynebacterium sp. 366]
MDSKRPRAPRRRGTLASIADELGVSPTTVSNAYNRPDQLSKALRKRILETAEKRGYPGPDPLARSLRRGHAGAIGVLLTEELTYAFEDQASLEFVSGVSIACSEMKASMLLIPAGVNPDARSQDAAHLINQASVDGFIVYSVAADDPHLDAVMHRGLPTVICDQPVNTAQAHFVGIDDREAIKPAAQAVVEAGHTHIGILCIRLDRDPNNGPVSPQRRTDATMDVQRLRVAGVLDVLTDAGLDPTHVPIVERHINNRETAYSAAQELLTAHPELTAVICTTDSMAMGVLEYTRDQGISIPDDLSVTGFDGIPQAIAAGITTVRQPSREKGRLSGTCLAAIIRGNHDVHAQFLDTELVPGTSVQPPRLHQLG